MCGTNTFDNKVSNMKLCTCAFSTFQHLTGAPLLKALPSIGYHCRPFKKHALDSDTQDQHASQQSVRTPRVAVSNSHRRGCHSLPQVGPWDSASVVTSAFFPIEPCSRQDLETSHPSTPGLSESPQHTTHSCQRLPSAEYRRG